MCNPACLNFIKQNLRAKEVKGRSVLEAGAKNYNGSARDLVAEHKPRKYVGTDIQAGPGVDWVCDAGNLIKEFGENSFDVVITTEMLEHVEDWRGVVHNLKGILKPGGVLYITTRSKGFPYHEYPGDFWRYELDDMRAIFADLEIMLLDSDQIEPGVFLKAVKPGNFVEVDLTDYKLFSILTKPDEPPVPPAPAPTPMPTDYVPNDKPPHEWGIA